MYENLTDNPVRTLIIAIIIIDAIAYGFIFGKSHKELTQKEQVIREWQDEGGNVYMNGVLQTSEFDPDGLNLKDFKVGYKNGKLYISNL